MNRPDPTATHRVTTAAVPEWAAEVTVGVPRMLAEIARLREQLDDQQEQAARHLIERRELRRELAALRQVSVAAADFRAEYLTIPRNIHAYTVAFNSLGYAIEALVELNAKAEEAP